MLRLGIGSESAFWGRTCKPFSNSSLPCPFAQLRLKPGRGVGCCRKVSFISGRTLWSILFSAKIRNCVRCKRYSPPSCLGTWLWSHLYNGCLETGRNPRGDYRSPCQHWETSESVPEASCSISAGWGTWVPVFRFYGLAGILLYHTGSLIQEVECCGGTSWVTWLMN